MRILIVGNWKMHLNASQASTLVHRLQERIKIYRDVEVVLAPSMLTLQPMSVQIDRRKFRLAAQNTYYEDEGAYRGEVSLPRCRERKVFSESDDEISKKVRAALRNDISPILCVGETKHERLEGETKQVIHDQLSVGLRHISNKDLKNLVIGYEPVWAVSKGEYAKDKGKHAYAKPDQVKEAVDTIRKNLAAMFGERSSKKVRILYGGSVHADIARGYLEVDGIDGLLVGGASLNYHQFSDIVDAAYRMTKEESDG